MSDDEKKVTAQDIADQAPEATVREYKLQMVDDFVLVARDPAPEKTAGGIELPKESRDIPVLGTVISCGPGRYMEGVGLIQPQFGAGDRVMFSEFSHTRCRIRVQGVPPDAELVLLRMEDVSAVVVDEWEAPA